MMKYFKLIDLFGVNYNFEFEGSQRHLTLEGACLSILTIISIIVVSFIFGQDIIFRKNIKITAGKEMTPDSIIDFKKFPLAIVISDESGVQSDLYDSLFHLKIEKVSLDATYNIVSDDDFKFDDCKNQVSYYEGYSGDKFRKYLASSNLKHYCFDFKDYSSKLIIKNTFGAPNSDMLKINVLTCHHSNDPKIKKECKFEKEKLSEKIMFQFFYYNSYIQNKNFDNPIEYSFNSLFYNINLLTSLANHFLISKDKLISDEGFIFEDSTEINFYNIPKIESHLIMNSDSFVELEFIATDLITTTNRSFMKIQELLANIGGFTNFIFLSLNLLLTNYFKFKYNAFIHSNCFIKIIHNNSALKKQLKSSSVIINNNNNNINNNNNNLHNNASIEVNSKIVLDTIPRQSTFNRSTNIRNNELIATTLPISLRKNIEISSCFNENQFHRNEKNISFKTLFGDLEYRDINDKNPKLYYLNYLSYLSNVVCSCIKCLGNKERKEYYRKELLRVEKLLNFNTLTEFLTEEYAINFYS